MAEMHLQAKEHPRLPAKHQKLRRGLEQSLPHSLRGTNPAYTLISDFQPLELRDNKFLLFKLPQLWFIVTVTLPKNTYI